MQEAVSKSIENLQKEIESLNGSIKLCKEIQNNNTDNNSFDEAYYWEEISGNEAKGRKFVDMCKDYAGFEQDLFYRISKYYFPLLKHPVNNKCSLLLFILAILIFSIIRGVSGVLIWKNNSFWEGFLAPFIVFVIISIIVLPLFLLKDKYPKLANIITTVFFIAAVLFLLGIAVFIVYALINKVFKL